MQPSQEADDIFPLSSLPDDSVPLFACKSQFDSAEGQSNCSSHSSKALLTMQLGDLIRVVSLLDAAMLYGFHERTPEKKGWFPKRCVEQLKDPLDGEQDVAPVAHLGDAPPPLPEIPHSLLFRV